MYGFSGLSQSSLEAFDLTAKEYLYACPEYRLHPRPDHAQR